MPKEKILVVDNEARSDHRLTSHTLNNAKKLVKLLFSSYGVLISALSLMAMAVLNGDAFNDFTGGLIINLDDFLYAMGGDFAYFMAMLLSAIVLIGPVHYYASFDKIDIIVIVIIVFLLTGFVLGKMFRNPWWALMSGVVVMISFVITITTVTGILDYFAQSSGLPISISEILNSMLEALFGMDTFTIYFTAILENGLLLGGFGALWGLLLMPKKKTNVMSVSLKCNEGKICKI